MFTCFGCNEDKVEVSMSCRYIIFFNMLLVYRQRNTYLLFYTPSSTITVKNPMKKVSSESSVPIYVHTTKPRGG